MITDANDKDKEAQIKLTKALGDMKTANEAEIKR
jgi:hypothetical protein